MPSRFCRARCTARCSATTVLPVPAEPATRAGPAKSLSTISALRRMEKDHPLFPGQVERLREQFVDVLDDPEPPLRVGVRVRIGGGRGLPLLRGHARGRELEQKLRQPQPAGAAASSRKASSLAARAASPSQSDGKPSERSSFVRQPCKRRRLGGDGSRERRDGDQRVAAARSLQPARGPQRSGPRRSSGGASRLRRRVAQA